MPASSAFAIGALNAFGSTRQTAMPSTFALIALLNALTISLTFALSEPVHWYEQPSSLQASSAPYFVGTKNGFVVTWLTNVNFSSSPSPNTPLAGVPPFCAAFDVVDLLSPPQAFSRNAV